MTNRAPTTKYFTAVIKIESTDPPPDWGDKTIELLDKELRMRFGRNARVNSWTVSTNPDSND